MNNLANRILTCIIGVPAVCALIFCLPQYNFIGLSLLIIILAASGSAEMSRMLFGKYSLAAFLSCAVCAVHYVQLVLNWKADAFSYLFLLSILIILGIEVKRGEADDFKSSITHVAKSLLLLIYPGYLLSFIIGMLALENTSPASVVLFLILVFSNDIFAYVFGMLFGRGHGNVFKVSPKKSMAGFIGGTLSCVGICYAYWAVMASFLPLVPVWTKAALALVISAAANIGDLAESVFKRSAGVKDSGNIIPGRGGILDSIDSIIVAAPFFYTFWNLI